MTRANVNAKRCSDWFAFCYTKCWSRVQMTFDPDKAGENEMKLSKNFYYFVKEKKKRKRERGERHDVFRSLNLSTSFYRMRVNKKYEFNIRNWAQISELSLCGTCTSKKVFFTRNLQNNIYVPRCRVSTNFG